MYGAYIGLLAAILPWTRGRAVANIPFQTALARGCSLHYWVEINRGQQGAPRAAARMRHATGCSTTGRSREGSSKHGRLPCPYACAGHMQYWTVVERWQQCSTVGRTAPARGLYVTRRELSVRLCGTAHRVAAEGRGADGGVRARLRGSARCPRSPVWPWVWRRAVGVPCVPG